MLARLIGRPWSAICSDLSLSAVDEEYGAGPLASQRHSSLTRHRPTCGRCRSAGHEQSFEQWGGWGSNPRPADYEFDVSVLWFPTCANVPGIASALPQSARDARLPLAPSFAGYGEAPSECSTGADVRGAENLTTERGDSGDAQQFGAKVGHQAQPAAKC